MPKTILLMLFALLVASTATAQNVEDLSSFEKAIKPGAQLIYDVNMGGKRYQFIATLTTVADSLVFSWKTTGNDNQSGTVTTTAGALAKADALHNLFTSGDTRLDGETALVLSKRIFNDVATTSSATVKVNGKDDTPTVLSNVIGEYNFNLNGALVAIPGWELQGGGEFNYSIQVLESAKFPLIYQLNAGFNMLLTEIKNP